MQEAWIAFIVLCWSPTECTGTRHYANKMQYSERLCRDDAYGWAVQMKAISPDKNYGFGCKKNDYVPPEVK